MENSNVNERVKCWSVLPALEYVCRRDSSTSKALGKFLVKQIWSPTDRQEILETLSSLFVQSKDRDFCDVFRPILLDIITRSCTQIEREEFSFRKHQDFCIALSWCLGRPDILRFVLEYVKGKPSFLKKDEDSAEPRKKKAKKNKLREEAVCKAAWMFTRHLGDAVTKAIQLEDLLPYLSHDKEDVRWFACQAVMELQRMVSTHRQQFLQNYFSQEQIRRLKISHSVVSDEGSNIDALCVADQTSDLSHTKQTILETDLCSRVTCVAGVLIQTVGPTDTQTLDLLPVPSNQSNLHSLAVAVAMATPVLFQGVVGSGKTTLVEHLARLTGRQGPPGLLKVQLGDQMDSKALLGTYCCTEVPGEFVWRAGVLTQAVRLGSWLILEDIDHAPMEVISTLLPLLETGTLSVPGHGDNLRPAPGFHLFATQRLVSSKSGWQRQHASNSSLLDKLWTTILVEPLSRLELSQVLCTKYPKLETVIDKLLDIYFLLSAGDHQMASEADVSMETDTDIDTDTELVGKFLSHDGRLISTRDLMTWCSRIAHDFDVSSTATAHLVFQEAVDCFVACLSKPAKRMPLAEAIGAKLNVTKVKAEFFCEKYKPDVQVSPSKFIVGRVSLPIREVQVSLQTRSRSLFSYTRQSCVLLERVTVSVSNREPVLLVGETGTGKTSSVQYLAEQIGHKLHVINMNQQSDSADLLGGFKPVDVRHIVKPFFEDFEILFCKSFSRKQNAKFIGHLLDTMAKRKWDTLFSLIEHTTNTALKKAEKGSSSKQWKSISRRLAQLKIQIQQTQNALAFTFLEGTLVKAIRAGDWVLLDEINLAAMETLECLSGLLESDTGSVLLMERGDIEPVVRHPDFRLFACMNPATDVGKKDLSPGIRNRFTEFFVDELEDPQDLKILVSDYLRGLSLTAGQVDGIVKFYTVVRTECGRKLTDGTGHRPHYSLRTLCRALRYAALNRCGSVARSLYEGFCLSFLTQLDRVSYPVVEQLVCQHVLGKSNIKSVLKQALPAPPTGRSLAFEGYWISVGELEPQVPDGYILTPSVRANLRDLARVVAAGQHPVLIQGETSVGKTSLIRWLAQSTGNVCVRVNNHEHTDLQEYVGCYAADQSGKLVFKEGVMVEAMRKGQWIILDELNLAPTDVLEALNRLLDDNRELYIPETQETVKAHPKFMLFATQNPPGQYGGRKMLSRAFRNRFVELHFDEIPSPELQTILHERCNIPLSYAKRLVTVMLELQTRRRGSGVFAGKTGFMTLRDLFRWADRYTCPEMDSKRFYNWDKHLADQGFMLLAGRVRKPEETSVIQEVIQKHFKCTISPGSLFTLDPDTSPTTRSTLESVLGPAAEVAEGFGHVVWTQNMRRMAVLIGQAIRYQEPVLLVGETGCGKTTMCQMYASLYKTVLHSVNCHLHTESADFLGGLRPVRAHSQEDKKDKLFEWVDGPLVKAMKDGSMFLIDEISLADDSVLERLNSVLEPERTILLAEKGGGEGPEAEEVEQVAARSGFHVFATMNPGGDFGKKELSPALRNRFTEIWCPASKQRQDLIDIIEHNLHAGIHLSNQEDGTSGIGRAIMDFVDWFSNNELGKRCTVSIRDILTWVRFINRCAKTIPDDVAMETDTYNQLDPAVAYIHGACLVFLDGLGAGTTSQGQDEVVTQLRSVALTYLLRQVNKLTHQDYKMSSLYLLDTGQDTKQLVQATDQAFCIQPFSIPKGDLSAGESQRYALDAPGPCVNAQRVLRALQLPRPLLLEGSPGVGKTSLVSAIARAAGRELVRINLSEQTDVTDLFGADLPVEGAEGGVFAWRDGPLLQALKAGSWIVLDELNLASQSVLEGLNACLDHRAEVFVPELGRTFQIQHEKTRLFACQNPLNQGGGRKGLPRSFLNRFTQVYVEPLSEGDLMYIASSMYPDIATQTLSYMVQFNMKMHEETVSKALWGQRGSPWEFNLRDLFRWCDMLLQNQSGDGINPGEYVGLIFADRMRTQSDKQQVYTLYDKVFPDTMEAYRPTGVFQRGANLLQLGHSFLKVTGEGHLDGDRQVAMEILHQSQKPLESVLKCIEMNWMAILVGPTCSSKSAVVEMLSQLTGNQLNILAMNSAMDTTELLGGFEQADVSRHIEEFAVKAESQLQSLCQHCLLDSSPGAMETVARLQSAWKPYTQCQARGDKTTTVEELEILRSRVSALLSVVTSCKKAARQMDSWTGKVKEISRLRKSVLALKERLMKAVPGEGGGAFEWMDSVLVKSLQAGHWLLIDNVNFCSASVLDRLNALLEPNGVLSINERGVIDGQIPTIKPHPNFRLFLSMDPRHGEISRAMRNRGVEIYLPGEDDGGCFSNLDLRLMLACKGLTSKEAFDWLRHLHDDLREELPLGDKPGLQSLLQVVQHVVSHRNHGDTLQQALEAACRCVYVLRQRHSDTKKVASEILQKHLDQWPQQKPVGPREPELGLSPVRLPSVQQYVLDPAGSKVTRDVTVLVNLLESREASDSDDNKVQLGQKFALCHLLGHTSDYAIQFTADWLQNYISKNPRTQSKDVCKYGVDSLQEVCRQIQIALEAMKYREVIGQTQNDSADLPLDLQWNQQLLNKCLQSTDTDSRSTLLANLTSASYRLHTLQYFLVETSLLKKWLSQLENALRRDKERGCPTLHGSVVHLVAMFQLLVSAVTGLIPQMEMTSYDAAAKMVDGVGWFRRLYEVTTETLGTNQAASMLPLYWKWFHKKTLALFFQQLSDQKLLAIITTLQGILGKDDRKWKQFVKFWRSWGHPRPFQNEVEARYHSEATKIAGILRLHGGSTELLDKARVAMVLGHRQFIVNALGRLLRGGELDADEKDDLEKTLTLLLSQLTQHGLYSQYSQSGHQDMETSTETSGGETETSTGEHSDITLPISYVQLWPLFEYTSLTEGLGQLGEMLSTELNEERLRDFVDFVILFTPMSSVDVARLQKLNKDNLTEELSAVVSSLLTRLRKSTVTDQLTKWLDWPAEQDTPGHDNQYKCVHHMTLSAILYKLLSRANPVTSPSSPANVELSTPLKTHTREITQLSCISRHLWTHVSACTQPEKTTRMLDSQAYFGLLKHTLHSLKTLLPVDCIPEFYSIMEAGQTVSADFLQTVSQFLSARLSTVASDAVSTEDLVQSCLSSAGQLLENQAGDMGLLGTAWVHLGLLGSHLLAPKGPVDPVEKAHIKLKILKDELFSVETELEVMTMQHRLVTGQDITQVSPRLVHPRVGHLLAKSREITLQIEALTKQLAYRPPVSQYGTLVQDVENYLNSIGAADTVNKLTSKLQKQIQRPGRGTGLLQEVELWVKSQESFVAMVMSEYQQYRDVTEPFICTVNQVLHGIHVLFHTFRQGQHLFSLAKSLTDKPSREDLAVSLQQLMLGVGRFPTVSAYHPSCSRLAADLATDSSLTLVRAVTRDSQGEDELQEQSLMVTDSVLSSSLLHLLNEAKVIGNLTPDIVATLTHILEVYVSSWQQAEAAKRDREEEEASMYRFRSQEHGDGRTEEEIDKEEFEKNFPQFTKEFADLVEPTSLEDSTIREEVDTSPSLQVTDVQMTQICSVHQKLFKQLANTDWYKPASPEPMELSDWTKPVLASYTAAVTIGDSLSTILGSDVDGQLLGSHLVLSAVQQHYIVQATEQASSGLLERRKVYDIYRDSNVSEVLHCVPVLKAVTDRAQELLQEWPDHPTLKQVVEIVERIRSFPITAPVMKFLTGMELLLEKAQHWESNAASFVSMATQLADVSGLIVQWRKLELSCWSQLLEQELHRYQTAASKWWFHLYQLINAVLTPQDCEEDKPTTVEEVLKSLKQFLEQATLGDFLVRLDMLLAFHCHLVTVETGDGTQQRLARGLWNLHQFYSRFLATVQKELDSLRTPIEKELKGFVKIARWSDINYWALKQATEKTHRTLHKHIKQFQNVLRQPVQGILAEADGGDTTQGADNSAWRDKLSLYQEELLQQLKRYKVDALELGPAVVVLMTDWAPVLQKPAQLCTRFTRHWGQVVASAQYCQLIAGLDQFTGEVIEEIHELQALEVNRSDDKKKQKSDAKHFNLRKRKALSDLFKFLAKLGLSYRKGLALEVAESDSALLVPPLNLSVAMASDPAVQCVWEGCLHYYYRCLSRRAQFASVIISPVKELGIGNIERSKGFSSHLFQLLTEQYMAVEQTAAQYKYLKCAIGDVERIVQNNLVTCPQEEAQRWMTNCRQLLVQTVEGLSQFLVILHCCPGKQGEITSHPSPLAASQLHQMALARLDDEIVTETIHKIQNILKDVQNSQSVLQTTDSSLVTWSDLLSVQTILSKLSSMVPTLQEVGQLFCDPGSSHPNAFTGVLHFLCAEITSATGEFGAKFSQLEEQRQTVDGVDARSETGDLSDDTRTFSQKTEALVSAILLALQKLKKQHIAMETKDEDKTETIEDAEDEDDEVIKDSHLVSLVHDKLHKDSQTLDTGMITTSLTDLIKDIVKGDDSRASTTKCAVLESCLPLLHQYRGLVHHQLISAVATQRTVGKLLSVLLALFTDLATKGFCIPPELSDEMEGEGATEFCDMENAGMGEGEGVKNVSDQIEDEDELDEAKRPEDHKKQEDQDQPDVKSEENAIEMSEEFDAKVQDLEDVDKQEDKEEDDKDEDEEEVDKKMGELEGDDTDKLDEQMWGSDEEDQEESEEKKEEEGAGDGAQSQPELVAREENQDKEEADEGNQKDDKDQPENENQQPKDLDELDQENYDDDQVDPYHGDKQDEKQAPEDMDLPDDLKLDDASDTEEKEEPSEDRMEDNADEEDKTQLPPEEGADQEMEEDTKDEDKAEGDEGAEEKEDKDEESADRQEEEGTEDPGLNPEDNSTVEQQEDTQEETKPDDSVQAVEDHGKTSHDSETVEQSDTAQDQAGQSMENDQREADGTGQASSEQVEGHQGQKSTRAADVSSEGKRKKYDRQPGKSDNERSLGSTDQKYKKLKTTDTREAAGDQQQDSQEEEKQSDLYEHVTDSSTHHDAQTLDVATTEQQQEQGQIKPENQETEEDADGDVDMEQDDDKTEEEEQTESGEVQPTQLKKKSKQEADTDKHPGDETLDDGTDQTCDIPGEKVATATVGRGPESTIHTAMEHLHLDNMTFDLESLRAELESQLGAWNQPDLAKSKDMERGASELWHRYELLTSSLAQDLCEQLRLVLEPSQATKLRGDYRTGKRLNMRKVIPYVASQFRKDKIWLRRTKPSKRQYQVMLAIDDSSSMVDNHSKQMAFESLALISNALTLLEVGQLSICRFGETVHGLHPFTEQFSSQSGASLLQYLTFEQKKTKIAQLLQYATATMMEARQKQQGSMGNPETSQLLLIVSDGRGLFTEGVEAVKAAVRQAREASVFIVFVIIDNPVNKDSILDIKVPVFKPGGQIPEIKSYMDSFPFPFYIILRDINSLPIVLSDALRQWFELVTAVDR